MSDSETSSPLPPLEAAQVAMRAELETVKHSLSVMENRFDELSTQINLLAQSVNRITTTQGDPSQAGPSRPYVPFSPPTPPSPPPPPPHVPPQEQEGEAPSIVESRASSARRRRKRREEDDDRGLKFDLPKFKGSMNPDDYFEWLSMIERVFEYNSYSENKKFRVAILKFKGYAFLWWDSLRKQRERDGKEPIREWDKLKKALEKRFVPKEYKQELYHKLHTLKQEKRTVGEYIREFEACKIRCDLPEEKEHTI